MVKTAKNNRLERARQLWGRAKGRPLSRYQAELVTTKLPKIRVDGSCPDFIQSFPSAILEIGFGGAEHFLSRAQSDPRTGYIGAEPFLNGVGKALAGIEDLALENVRLHHGDARDILKFVPEHSLAAVQILYPDPWPKKRHFKRRLIQPEFIAKIAGKIRPGGQLFFASDIISYIDHALAIILDNPHFDWSAKQKSDWFTPPKDWPGTRYEAKAIREGRTPHYLYFRRN